MFRRGGGFWFPYGGETVTGLHGIFLGAVYFGFEKIQKWRSNNPDLKEKEAQLQINASNSIYNFYTDSHFHYGHLMMQGIIGNR